MKFDPWDWLGLHCGGYHETIDATIISALEELNETGSISILTHGDMLICTLLCNTDAFEFDEDPTQLRFVGDEQFQTLDALIEAWDCWYDGRYQ